MKREDCWMTFSEALDNYLEAREAIKHFGPGRDQDRALLEMEEAAEHMDALTSLSDTNTPLEKTEKSYYMVFVVEDTENPKSPDVGGPVYAGKDVFITTQLHKARLKQDEMEKALPLAKYQIYLCNPVEESDED